MEGMKTSTKKRLRKISSTSTKNVYENVYEKFHELKRKRIPPKKDTKGSAEIKIMGIIRIRGGVGGGGGER